MKKENPPAGTSKVPRPLKTERAYNIADKEMEL
jgi:hypothetical protein